MIKRIELGTSYIIPKGVLGFYTTLLFWIFEEKRVKPFVHFDKHTFYTMCRKDAFLQNEQLKDLYMRMLKADFAH